jgi:hypothetical protein
MPRQNRVTPNGDLIRTVARGALMGNRGCLHDSHGQIRRAYVTARWIICLLDFKGVRRNIMTPGRWTELFFLDEATALAAGHRPCAYCQRARFDHFRTVWAAANPTLAGHGLPRAPVIDAVLHRERITADQQKVTYTEAIGRLPNGVFIKMGDEQPFLVLAGNLLPWQPDGYQAPMTVAPDRLVQVLTPHSIVRTLAHGYQAGLHVSAGS